MNKERETSMFLAAKILSGPINKINPNDLDTMLEHGNVQGAFVCGVRWADRNPESPWVNITDRMPEDSLPTVNHEEYGRKCIRVMVLMKSGNIMSTTRMYSNGTWYFNLPLRMRDDIVYWMPVFPVPNE